MAAKPIVIFDFDRTLIEEDSDRWIISQMGLTHLYAEFRDKLPWTSLMDMLLGELHSNGITIEDITECLRKVPLHPRTEAVIRTAYDLGCDLKVVSDANTFYIETILKNHGLYDCFSEIISNQTKVTSEGRLRIFPYHDLVVPHGCNLCPPNMCKGTVINRIQASLVEHKKVRFIYLGDGRGDYCPILKLGKWDFVMPRKNFPLWSSIWDNPKLVKPLILGWSNGEELEKILLNLINNVTSCE